LGHMGNNRMGFLLKGLDEPCGQRSSRGPIVYIFVKSKMQELRKENALQRQWQGFQASAQKGGRREPKKGGGAVSKSQMSIAQERD